MSWLHNENHIYMNMVIVECVMLTIQLNCD
jgi:hypothetical protein